MDLGTSGHEQLDNNDQQQQQQYPQQQSSAAAATPLSPFRPAPLGAASMLQAASAYYSTPPLMHPHHHDLASATKMSKLTTSHSPSGNGLGSAPVMKSGNNDHKTSDQVATEQAREILRQAVVTAVTESNKAAAVANNNNNNNNNVVKPYSKPGAVRYRECQKNHAASIGGHAIDGCGEFMPGGDEGDADAHRCAACDCHRNFHRREVEGECDCRRKPSSNATVGVAKPAGSQQQQQAATMPTPPVTTLALIGGGGQMTPLTMAAAMSAGGPTDSDDPDDGPGHIVTSGGMMMSMRSPSAIKKRFRTKFTTEQKDKMLAFAEEVGWRIQKHDEAAVHEFCSTVGVKRHVLKVWMHNNKHTMGKKP